MKTYKYFFIVCLCILAALTASAQDSKEVAAIKSVLEKETQSFFNVNRKDWEDTWMKVPYAYWSYSDSTGTSYIEGWDNISKSFDDYFKTQVSSRPIDVAHQKAKIDIERKWHEIRVYGTGAYVHYTQKVKDNIAHDETSQIRVLEKKDGKWKVICVGVIAFYPKD